MQRYLLMMLTALSLNALAAQPSTMLPSCDLKAQRAHVGKTGEEITDVRQAHISARANVLAADISTARKARKITEAEANKMTNRVKEVQLEIHSFVTQQGFLERRRAREY
jgi:uncharacterized protein YdbL (DUF1318 family)